MVKGKTLIWIGLGILIISFLTYTNIVLQFFTGIGISAILIGVVLIIIGLLMKK